METKNAIAKVVLLLQHWKISIWSLSHVFMQRQLRLCTLDELCSRGSNVGDTGAINIYSYLLYNSRTITIGPAEHLHGLYNDWCTHLTYKRHIK